MRRRSATAGGDWPLVGGATCDLLAAGRTAGGDEAASNESASSKHQPPAISECRPSLLFVVLRLAENGERCVGFDREVCDRGCVTERIIASASV